MGKCMAKSIETVMLFTQKNHIYHLTYITMVLLMPVITAMLLFSTVFISFKICYKNNLVIFRAHNYRNVMKLSTFMQVNHMLSQ